MSEQLDSGTTSRITMKELQSKMIKPEDLDKFSQKMDELDLFKDQFVKVVEKNVDLLKKARQDVFMKMNVRTKNID